MKLILTLLVITIFFLPAQSQQWKLITSYSLGLPQQEMKETIQPASSFQLGVLYQLPGPLSQLWVGAELGIGGYAHKTIEQTFQFGVNNSSKVPVNYSSNTFNADLQTRVNLLPNKNLIIPYINAKGGWYNFFSNVYVEDPENPNNCKPLDKHNIINDATLYWSLGGGVQADVALFSKKRKNPGKVLIDIAANSVRGGTLDYINTKHLEDAQTFNDKDSKPLEVRFIKASTQRIYEHTVAQVYTSPLRMLEFRAGVVIRLGKSR